MKKINKILKRLRLRTLISLGLMIIVLPVIIFVMFKPSNTEAAWYDERYQYRKILTIDDTNVSGSGSLTNFPVLVNLTSDQSLNDNAQADGDDIIFVSSTGTLLDFEIESYATGTLVAWVEIPSLSGSTDTSFYMYYGSPSASSLENPSGIWGDSIYQAVYHFNNNLSDSSSNGRTGTNNGSSDTSGGKIGNGRDFENSESDYVDIGTWNVTGQALTLSGWVKIESFPVGTDFRFISKADGTGASNHTWMVGSTDDNARARLTTTSTVTYLDTLDNDYTATDTWYNFAFTYDGTNGRLYVNGVQTYFAGQTGDITSNAKSILLGANPTPASNFLDGIMDEIRIISATRSADWLATEYTNQNNSSNFLSLSAEQSRILPPLAYWNLDQGVDNTCSGGTNDVCDSSSGASDGAKTGASWQPEDLCVSGKCLLFDGTDDTVTVSNTLSNTQSVSFWVKIMSTSTTEQILDLNGTDYFTSTSGVLTVNGFGTDTIYVDAVSGATTLSANKWHFVTVTSTSGFSSSAIKMGQISTNYGNLFLDEVKLYNYALSANEIKGAFASRGLKVQTNTSLGGENQRFLSDGLVGYWNLNETSGNASDNSGNTNTLTNNGVTTYSTGKFANGSEHVPASSQYLSTATTISGVKSVSFWVNPDSTTNYYSSLTSGAYITSSSGTLSATGFTNPTIYVNGKAGSTIVADQWQLVTVTSETATNADTFYIGRQSTNYFDGTMDEFRLYNRSLSPSEVQSLYNWGPKPLLHMNMDQGTGTTTIFDNSGQGNNGSTTGSMTNGNWVSGKLGGALDFDGTDDTVVVNHNWDNTMTGDLSFSTWVYIDSLNGGTTEQYRLVDDITGDTSYARVRLDGDGDWTAQIETTSGVDSCTDNNKSLTAGRWHHIAFTWDVEAVNCKTYVNGVMTTDNTLALTGTTTTGTSDMVIGGTTGIFFNGKVDDLRVYNYTRNSKQIVEDMNGGHPVGGSPIGSQTIYWKFDETKGTTANDSMGNTNGTIDSNLTWATKSNCKINGCLLWDAAGEEVSIASASDDDVNFTGSEQFSGSAWVYINTMPGSGEQDAIIAKWDGTTTARAYRLYVENDDADATGNFEVQIMDQSTGQAITASQSNDSVSQSAWYHVGWTFNGGTAGAASDLKLYVNGKLAGSNSANASFLGLEDVSADFTVGEYDSTDAVATNTAFAGYIDEVKIYSSELSSSEILIDMNANSAINIATGTVESTQIIEGAGNPPLGYWPMDDNAGGGADIVDDVSGNNNHGDNHDMDDSNWVPGVYGSGLFFNGTNENVIITPATTFHNLGAVSVSAWIKPRSDGGSSIGRIVSKGSWMISVSDSGSDSGDFTFYRTTSGTEVRAEAVPNSLSLNTWQHVMATWDGGLDASEDIKLYVNGREVTYQTQQDGTGSVNDDSGNLLTFGSEPGGGFRYDGYMDDVKIWNYALTPAQAAYDYNRGRPVAHWRFDECQGSTVNSSAQTNLSGTITIGGTGDFTSVGTCGSGTSTESWNHGSNGKYNSALGLDGTNDFADMGDPASGAFDFSATNSFSLAAWIYHDDAGASTERIIAKRLSGSSPLIGYYLAVTSTNQLQGTVDDGTNTESSTSAANTVPTGQWAHVAYVVDRTAQTGTLYMNGIQVDQDSISAVGSLANSNTLRVGSASGSTTGAFDGRIDDVRIYNYAISATQLKKIMNNDSAARFGPDSGNP